MQFRILGPITVKQPSNQQQHLLRFLGIIPFYFLSTDLMAKSSVSSINVVPLMLVHPFFNMWQFVPVAFLFFLYTPTTSIVLLLCHFYVWHFPGWAWTFYMPSSLFLVRRPRCVCVSSLAAAAQSVLLWLPEFHCCLVTCVASLKCLYCNRPSQYDKNEPTNRIRTLTLPYGRTSDE